MMGAQKLTEDANARMRWSTLQAALATRYANAAEAYIAMGGRAGGELSSQQLERSLQDLNGRVLGLRRGAVPARTVDVHGILADVESAFPSGISFQNFATVLSWEDRKQETLRTKEILASRVMAGAPAAAIRTSRENESPLVRGPAKVQVGSQNTSGGQGDQRSMLFPEWKGKKWTGSRAPATHLMQQQRKKALANAAVGTGTSGMLLRRTGIEQKKNEILAIEAKISRQIQQEEARATKTGPDRSAEALVPRLKEPEIPSAQTHPGLPASAARPLAAPEAPVPVPVQDKNASGMSAKASELSDRLADLNAQVFQQKLSLAETEKNVLLKERQELQAQIRQLNAFQKQSAQDMQNKMTDQFGKAMKETFEQIKDVMKSIQGPGAGGRQDANSANERFEEKVRDELLPLTAAAVADNPEGSLVDKRSSLYGPLNTSQHNYFDSVISVRAETEGERMGNGFFFHLYDAVEKIKPDIKQSKDHVDAGNLHSTRSPFLLAILNSLQYNPVLSWYTVDVTDFPHAGSVGKLARMDPMNGQDYVDDFLLEMLIAIRLNQLSPPSSDPLNKQSILGTIMPVFFGGENPQRFSRNFAPFPREKLHLLSNKPSIETAKVAASLLHSIGVSTPEHFLRLSIREVVGKMMDFPGVWMDKYESKAEAQVEAAKLIIGLARAEHSALVAKNAEAVFQARRSAGPIGVEDDSVEVDEDFEDIQSDEDDDELTRQNKRTLREQKKALQEEKSMRALARRQEEHELSVEVEKKKNDSFALFESSFRDLGFANQAQNLASLALKNRDVTLGQRLESILQKQEPRDGHDEKLQKRKLEKALRMFARTEGQTKKNSFENLHAYVTAVKAFKKKVAGRLNLKEIYFRRLVAAHEHIQMCVAYCDRMLTKSNSMLLRQVWDEWQAQRDADAEQAADPERVDVIDPSQLASLLRKLEEAVVETHQKHSSLLEMTNNEAAMDSLLETLSPEACDNLRDAGITSLEHLLHLTKGPEKSGPFDSSKLKEYGITDAVDLNRIETFLIKPESQEAGGSGQPAGDYDQKREQLLEDMSSLREKLDLKKERLMAEFPDENTTQNDQKQSKHKDPNLNVLHDLLNALGVTPESNSTLEEASASAVDGAGSDESEKADGVPSPAQREQDARDKETKDYINKLKGEGLTNQSVLQALAHSLGDVEENLQDTANRDQETDEAKNVVGNTVLSLQETMDKFASAMQRARALLDNENAEGEDSDHATGQVESQKHEAEKTKILERLLKEALAEPHDRAESLALGNHTSAEAEAQKLAADVDRRSKYADSLESENIHLKQQLESMRAMAHQPQVAKRGDPDDSERRKVPWFAGISDPELAAKYSRPLDDDEDDSFMGETANFEGSALEDRFLDCDRVQDMLRGNDTPTNFGYRLDTVDGPVTRSDIFDSLLEDKIQRGRSALQEHIALTKAQVAEVDEKMSSVEARLKEIETKSEELQATGSKAYRVNTNQRQEEIVANDTQRRLAGSELKQLTNSKDTLLSSLHDLEAQYEALDLRKELDDMDRKMKDEVEAATEEYNGLIDAQELDPTPQIAERLAEARDKIARIESSWRLKRNLRLKEIEIEIMNEKMAADEELLKGDIAKSRGVFAQNADNARGELSTALQMMEDSVTNTARGRCRPEVLASMPAVQKLRSAVSRHKLAIDSASFAERAKILDQQRQRQEQEAADEQKKAADENLKKMRATDDLDHREQRLKELSETFEKKKASMLQEADDLLDSAKKACDGKSDFCLMYTTDDDGTRRHGRSLLLRAKALYDELQGSMEGGDDADSRSKIDNGKAEVDRLMAQVDDELKKLLERVKAARDKTEGLLKKDLRKISEELAGDVAALRKDINELLPSLDDFTKVDDSSSVRKELSPLEEKLRHSWARLAPKLDNALHHELSLGDKALDTVSDGIAKGKLSSAAKELQKAQEAYRKVQTASASRSE